MPFVKRLSPEERVGLTPEQVRELELALAYEPRRCPDCQRYSCSCSADHQREVAAFRAGRQP